MTEIVTCVRCGQWVHDPENVRVCAECKAADMEDENREEIEWALAYLDALIAIEISADANAGGCYSPSCSIAGAQWVKTTASNGC
jgi:uncharacterized paraquat-inducible protein A